MRSGRRRGPPPSARAAPTPCVGTSPSARAASWSRQPATNTAPSRPSAGRARAPVRVRQQRMVRAPLAVRRDRLRVRRRGQLRLAHQVELTRRAGANRAEEVAVRLLARMREPPLERMDEDRRAAVDDRKRVAPEPQRQPEPEVRREQRVRPLARQVRRRARDAEADRVERLAERPRALLGAAQQRLGVRDRRRPRERGGDPARRGNRLAAPAGAPSPAARRRRGAPASATSRSTDSSSYG